jgi:hypothetical protein
MADLPSDVRELAMLLTGRGNAVEVRYRADDGELQLAAVVYLPPGGEV